MTNSHARAPTNPLVYLPGGAVARHHSIDGVDIFQETTVYVRNAANEWLDRRVCADAVEAIAIRAEMVKYLSILDRGGFYVPSWAPTEEADET